MDYQINLYGLAFLLTMIITFIAAVVAWRRRRVPSGASLFWMMVAVVEWNLMEFLEASAILLRDKIIWSKLVYVGAYAALPCFFIFSMEYTYRQKWLTRRNIALLFVLPVVTVLLGMTNEWHHLIWTGFTPSPAGNNIVIYHHGVWFWVAVVYINTLMAVGTFFLFQFAARSRELYHYQTLSLVIAAIIPWAAFISYILEKSPLPGLDTTAIGFAFTGTILVFAIQRLQFLDVIPVAREVLVEKMSDGLLVLDADNRIVDINPAARDIFGIGTDTAIGQPIESLLVQHPPLIQAGDNLENLAQEFTLVTEAVPVERTYELRVSPITSHGARATGYLLAIREITSRKKAQQALQLANQQLEEKIMQVETLKEELREQAIRDDLTGLYNRRYLHETLQRELNRAIRENYPLSLVMVDVDHFKLVNDEFGHPVGDLVLKSLADQLTTNARSSDIVCRYGGEEFIAVLPHTSVEVAAQRAEEWRLSFAASCVEIFQAEIQATISLGIAEYPRHGQTSAELIAAVDRALYLAKTRGRNRVEVF